MSRISFITDYNQEPDIILLSAGGLRSTSSKQGEGRHHGISMGSPITPLGSPLIHLNQA